MLLTLSGRSFIKIQYSSFPLFPVAYPFCIAMQLQYYVSLSLSVCLSVCLSVSLSLSLSYNLHD